MSEPTKKKITAKQILAIIGVVLLVSLYLAALIFALIGTEWAKNMLYIALAGTFGIPIILYFILMFFKLTNPNKPQTIEVPVDDTGDSKDSLPDAESESGSEENPGLETTNDSTNE